MAHNQHASRHPVADAPTPHPPSRAYQLGQWLARARDGLDDVPGRVRQWWESTSLMGVIVTCGVVLLVLVFAVATVLFPAARGLTPVAMRTASMSSAVPQGSMAYMRPASSLTAFNSVVPGDVIAAQRGDGMTITRVVALRGQGLTRQLTTRDDASSSNHPTPVTFKTMRGQIAYFIPLLGYATYPVGGDPARLLGLLLGLSVLAWAARRWWLRRHSDLPDAQPLNPRYDPVALPRHEPVSSNNVILFADPTTPEEATMGRHSYDHSSRWPDDTPPARTPRPMPVTDWHAQQHAYQAQQQEWHAQQQAAATQAAAARADYERAQYERAEYEREQYEREQYEREQYERAEYERAQYERADYERAQYEREQYEREHYDREQRERGVASGALPVFAGYEHVVMPDQEPYDAGPSFPAPEYGAAIPVPYPPRPIAGRNPIPISPPAEPTPGHPGSGPHAGPASYGSAPARGPIPVYYSPRPTSGMDPSAHAHAPENRQSPGYPDRTYPASPYDPRPYPAENRQPDAYSQEAPWALHTTTAHPSESLPVVVGEHHGSEQHTWSYPEVPQSRAAVSVGAQQSAVGQESQQRYAAAADQTYLDEETSWSAASSGYSSPPLRGRESLGRGYAETDREFDEPDSGASLNPHPRRLNPPRLHEDSTVDVALVEDINSPPRQGGLSRRDRPRADWWESTMEDLKRGVQSRDDQR